MNVSIAVQAHPARRVQAEALAAELAAPIAWSEQEGDVWDTHRRARLACDPGAEWSLVVQDDALLGRDFRVRLEALLTATPYKLVGLYYRDKPRKRPMIKAARAGRAAGGFAWPVLQWGIANAIAGPLVPAMLEWCEALVDAPARRDDVRIRRWALENDLLTWYPLPSLVDHRPELSSLVGNGPNRGRQARYFA